MDVYIHGMGEDKQAAQMMKVFDMLKSQAGERGFTFLGRHVTKEMTFEDVLKKTPARELEEGGSAIKALMDPAKLGSRFFTQYTSGPLLLATQVLGVDPLIDVPGGATKYLRRKSQEYLDPEGKGPIPPRPAPSTWMQTLRDVGGKFGAELRTAQERRTEERRLVREQSRELARLLSSPEAEGLKQMEIEKRLLEMYFLFRLEQAR
jgi:hypothetical protein